MQRALRAQFNLEEQKLVTERSEDWDRRRTFDTHFARQMQRQTLSSLEGQCLGNGWQRLDFPSEPCGVGYASSLVASLACARGIAATNAPPSQDNVVVPESSTRLSHEAQACHNQADVLLESVFFVPAFVWKRPKWSYVGRPRCDLLARLRGCAVVTTRTNQHIRMRPLPPFRDSYWD